MNRGAIWHGWVDTTDHSGKVIEAPPLMHMGIPASPDGHCGECPKCGGRFPLIASGWRIRRGIRVAILAKTTCGATLMPA